MAALALVLVALLGMTVKVATRQRLRVPGSAPEMPAAPEIAPRPHVAPPRSTTPRSAPRERTGVAILRGVVQLPPGQASGGRGDDTDDADRFAGLDVVADDGTRSFTAHIAGAGRFAFHLPPGHYEVIATLGDLVGRAGDVVVRAGGERDVDIPLGAGAEIKGALRGATSDDISVAARPAGRASDVGVGDASGEEFSVRSLIPGRVYDLTFSGAAIRSTTLRGIVAPAEGVEVGLERLAVVRGAVGFPRGERCPISVVRLEKALGAPRASADQDDQDDGDDGTVARPGADCRFELTVPENMSVATVVAEGPGWFLEEQVDIPARGDPAPLCLNPPCRENPTEGLARLRVTLEGATPSSVITADASSVGGPRSAYHSCSSEDGWCLLDELPVGDTYRVDGYGVDCRAEARTIVLASGDNSIRLPCRRQRRVEGVVTLSDGALPQGLIVRCAGGGFHTVNLSRVFEIRCGAEDASLEFQVARGKPWQSVPLPREQDPAFVELSLR